MLAQRNVIGSGTSDAMYGRSQQRFIWRGESAEVPRRAAEIRRLASEAKGAPPLSAEPPHFLRAITKNSCSRFGVAFDPGGAKSTSTAGTPYVRYPTSF